MPRAAVHLASSLAIFLSSSAFAQEASCLEKLSVLTAPALQMTYQEFDQSPNGWRKLGNCYAEAAVLIQRYVSKQEHEIRGTRWHLVQVLAMSGETAKAAQLATQTLNPPETESQAGFSWNTYVLATIAFLKNDRGGFDAQLEEHRKRTKQDSINAANLQALERLARCFGKGYAVAYACAA
jgi:hypothetical protein